jgi:hypothetical protein
MERPQLTTSALKTDLHTFLFADYFMDRCLQFMHELKTNKFSVFSLPLYHTFYNIP